MSFFNNMLKDNETLFKNDLALDYSFIPKLVPYRENEQHFIASCIKPLLQQRNGKNLLIYGNPGIGKTVATLHVLKELEQEFDEVYPIYINCWKKDTSYKVALELCHSVNFKFVQQKNKEELFEAVKKIINKKSAVFVFDEIDKLTDFSIIYSIIEDIYKKTIIFISNTSYSLSNIDKRVISRLQPQLLQFKKYNLEEIKGILKQRCDYALQKNVIDNQCLEIISKKANEFGDVRVGLFLIRDAVLLAEEESKKKVFKQHVFKSISNLHNFKIKDLEEYEQDLLELIKTNSGKKFKEIYEIYKKQGGTKSYKTVQRSVNKLKAKSLIKINVIEGGKQGKTSIIEYKQPLNKKLTDFKELA